VQHRTDIDGLRAIAVLSVVLFHLNVPGVSGGFVGVDIFFVISGYLISGIICREIDKVSFRFINFYERRIRRIFPALFLVLIIANLAAFYTLTPLAYRNFGQSSAAAGFSFSNIYFYKHSDYFGFGSSLLPLLHTWSLGVEEQFYIMIPPTFFLGRRTLGLRWSTIILPMMTASFVFCVWQTTASPNAAFYLPLSRAWEFLLGSMLATALVPTLSRSQAEIAGWVGLLLIGAGMFGFTPNTPFPGVAAVVPCLGAALLIHAGESGLTSAGRLLSFDAMTWVGLISYSVYLWHWPIIVFSAVALGGKLTAVETMGVLAVIVAISTLSWRYVEQPFRTRRNLFTRNRLFAGAGVGCLVFLSVGFIISHSIGLPQRFDQAALRLAKGSEDFNPRRDACTDPPREKLAVGEVCDIGDPSAPISFALVGDSYADAMMPGVAQAATLARQRGVVLIKAGCYPLMGLQPNDKGCSAFMDGAFQWLGSARTIDTVLLIGRWTTAVEGYRIGSISLSNMYITDRESREASYAENRAVFARGLDRIASTLKDCRIFVLAHIPEQHVNVPMLAALEARFGATPEIAVQRASVDQRESGIRALLDAATLRDRIQQLDSIPAFCDRTACKAIRDGRSLYADDNHLSNFGAEELARSGILDPVFAK
jgi:peptidoglycan/LPS O-acetylase OafA/YrhL